MFLSPFLQKKHLCSPGKKKKGYSHKISNISQDIYQNTVLQAESFAGESDASMYVVIIFLSLPFNCTSKGGFFGVVF